MTDPVQGTEQTTRRKGRWSFYWRVLLWLVIAAGVLLLLWIGYAANCCTYTTRAKVSEGLNLAAGPKIAVAQFHRDEGRFPASNEEAGVSDVIRSKFVSAVRIQSGGHIVVIFGGDSPDEEIVGKTLVLQVEVSENDYDWQCSSEEIEEQHLPAACR